MLLVEDTIAAIASAPGGAQRGIVRVSGPHAVVCLARCFVPEGDAQLSEVRRASVVGGWLQLPPPLGQLPCDLYLWPTARSYTRQPAAELHLLGSPPLLDAALRTVCAAGARLAEPGEFTFRAFLAGRLDLTQAEAVLGVIEARDRHELDTALTQLAGGLLQPLRNLRNQLLDLLAQLEAGLDFAEEDLQLLSSQELDSHLAAAAEAVQRLADQVASRGESPPEFRVVLTGWPNVGKSSLLNALAGESAALVSAVAGTTRDYLTRRIEIHGVPCLLIDTAGWDPGADSGVPAAAQHAAVRQLEQADLPLLCLDATRHLYDAERALLASPAAEGCVLVLTKVDGLRSTDLHLPAIATSSRTGEGLPALCEAIRDRAIGARGHDGCVVAGTAIRSRESLRLAAECLAQARATARARAGDELVAADLRACLEELGKIVGAVYTEDVLDRIFSRFCIGK